MGRSGTQRPCHGCGSTSWRETDKVCSRCRRVLDEHQALIVELSKEKLTAYRLPSGWPYLGLSGRDVEAEICSLVRACGTVVNKNDIEEAHEALPFFPEDHLDRGYGREVHYDWDKLVMMEPVVHAAILAYDKALRVAIKEHTKRENENGQYAIARKVKEFRDVIKDLEKLVAHFPKKAE